MEQKASVTTYYVNDGVYGGEVVVYSWKTNGENYSRIDSPIHNVNKTVNFRISNRRQLKRLMQSEAQR